LRRSRRLFPRFALGMTNSLQFRDEGGGMRDETIGLGFIPHPSSLIPRY
jgi:hypothetical protein